MNQVHRVISKGQEQEVKEAVTCTANVALQR